MMVFVPLTPAELKSWAESGSFTPSLAFAVTAAMRAAFGFATGDDEDAEHTALHIAALASLVSADRRLVAVAEASAEPVPSSEFGVVRVGSVVWPAVTALFGESADDEAGTMKRMIADRSVEDAWDDPAVAELLAEHELLWHGQGEWSVLTS